MKSSFGYFFLVRAAPAFCADLVLLTPPSSFINGLNDTNCHSLPPVTDSESPEWCIVGESLNTKRFGWDQVDDAKLNKNYFILFVC
jgi:hypothetical protein